jgi:hypothetical protein
MRVALTLALLLWALPALAQVYPQCPSGSPTSCTIAIHITSSATPVFAKLSARQYLFLQNTGYTFGSGTPTTNNNAVFCAIGSNNSPVTASSAPSTGTFNTIVIQPGGVYEPPQLVAPQSSFRVPAGDISCVAPFGDVWLTSEQE